MNIFTDVKDNFFINLFWYEKLYSVKKIIYKK